MKVMYFSLFKIDVTQLDGVPKKLFAQQAILQEHFSSENVYLTYFDGEGDFIIQCNGNIEKKVNFKKDTKTIFKLKRVYKEVVKFNKKNKLDALYFRISTLNRATNQFLKRMSNSGVKIFIEIPTYPFWKERFYSAWRLFKSKDIIKMMYSLFTTFSYWYHSRFIKKYVD